MSELPESSPFPSKSPPFREDCWTEEATATLVDAWGRRYIDLNRGNLRQKDWQEVADAVNSRHGHSKKTLRTDVQCKNRIDTLKKKYKVEKARVVDSDGAAASNWMFFDKLDFLIGPKMSETKSPPTAIPLPIRRGERIEPLAVALPQKRSAASVADDSYFRRNYSAVAAAAAAVDEDDDEEQEQEVSEEIGGNGREQGLQMLAKAIDRFANMYERVERDKQLQVIEFEKQRMQFVKDLEVQRMQLLMDTQVHLEKMKRANRSGSGSDGEISCVLNI
ncbi:hypothetical protein DCAR_0208983 [Daucus carota subsp. sativus]|uniref:MADF domain-containing protein n=1 Tax=Daucus carota subsp. sativus TaxID=79200 RepID=A0A166EXT4_DAUCS|nr:hypothetical protein DCAR_0208983 [Daucus carota subsp. sativus]